MKFKEYEKKMRTFEYGNTMVPPDNWIILHIDGDNFHKWTKEMDLETPYDKGLHTIFEYLTNKLMIEMNGIFSYHQSDEINILLMNNTDYLKRSVPKLVSKSVAITSADTTIISNRETKFATRVFALPNIENVVDYYRWRLADALRNSLNSAVYWALRDEGLSGKRATSAMNRKDKTWKHEYLFSQGINFNDLDPAQKRGYMTFVTRERRTAINRQTGNAEPYTRRVFTRQPPPRTTHGFGMFIEKYLNEEIQRNYND